MLFSELPSANSVKIGNLFYKPSGINERLCRSCRLVLLEAEDSNLPLGRTGSSTLVCYKNKKYVVTTRHELGIAPGKIPDVVTLETIRVVSSDEILTNIPIMNCLYESSNPSEEYHDLLIFEIDDTWQGMQKETPYFMEIEPYFVGERRYSMMIGHPTLNVVMGNYIESHINGETGCININVAISDCEIDAKYHSYAKYYRRYKNLGSRSDLDGFSGGPVFSIVGDIQNLEVHLDGIIVRGGTFIYIVTVDYLIRILGANG